MVCRIHRKLQVMVFHLLCFIANECAHQIETKLSSPLHAVPTCMSIPISVLREERDVSSPHFSDSSCPGEHVRLDLLLFFLSFFRFFHILFYKILF